MWHRPPRAVPSIRVWRFQLTPRQSTPRSALVIINLIKVGGLVSALNEMLIRSELRPIALGISAVMMAGGQGLESFLTAFFGGKVTPPPKPPESPEPQEP